MLAWGSHPAAPPKTLKRDLEHKHGGLRSVRSITFSFDRFDRFGRFSFFPFVFRFFVKISNFNWPGLGPASERRSAPTGRNGGRPRRCPSPGQLKFEILKLGLESSLTVRKRSETVRKRSENDLKRSETIRKRSETVRNRPRPSENDPKPSETVQKRSESGQSASA